MSIQFQSTPVLDVLLFSGMNYNCENQVPRELTGDARQEVKRGIKASYDHYKQELNLGYCKFLKVVEDNRDFFLYNHNLSSSGRASVVAKLRELANRRITLKENEFSWIHRFFHKIGQFFKGHGFQTKGEWGLEIASRIQKTEYDALKSKLKTNIYKFGIAVGETAPNGVIKGMKDEINKLSDEQFKEVLNDIIFMREEGIAWDGKKNKYVLFENLNDGKKKLFLQELLLRKDWYAQTFNIIDGTSHKEFASFITDEMVERFQKDLSQAIKLFNPTKNKFLFLILTAKVMQKYLANNGFMSISTLVKQIERTYEPLSVNDILKTKVLTDEEYNRLKTNINFNE